MEALQEKTGEVNPRLANRPTLEPVNYKYWQAFNTLNQFRSIGYNGVDPLRLGDIQAYLEMVGVGKGRPTEKFLRMIAALDRVFIAHSHKKESKASSK